MRSPDRERTALRRAVLVAAVLCAGLIAGRATAPDRTPARAPAAATPRVAHESRTTPRSWAAVQAATKFLGSLRWRVLVDDNRRRRVIARFATAAFADELQLHLARGLRDLRAAVSAGPVIARPAFLGYRVNRFSSGRASISVWGMAVFGSRAYEPVSQWATSTLDLVRHGDGWKVAGMRDAPGPSPQWSVEELAAEASTFTEYRDVP